MTSGWLARVRRLGRVVVWAVLCWGGAIALAGTMSAFADVLVCFAVAGAADSVSAVCRSTIVQTVTTEEMRGRMSALYIMVVGSGPYLGDAQAGALGSLLSRRVAVFSGGVLSMVGAVLVVVLCPALYRFDSDDYPGPGKGPSRPAGDAPAGAAHGRKGAAADPVEVTD
ncbi:MFS transporter [Streptomyces sp. ISL-100]|uniref:MFS transporter n=1 Tax=Streptomyces sp. ISL-100 TaxID=2819173 RepID=UPI001BEA1114|nr:MFS transporter [Streptomyces sp. ISL-100]MBT2399863.1 MFS transporter [Streptomyces sp. ISL-100]